MKEDGSVGHVARMEDNGLCIQILVEIPEGKWPLARPRHRWNILTLF
jgi:hypothetical protein